MAERAAGAPAEGEAMMREARKGDFLTRAVHTPRLDEKEFLAGVLRPFRDAIDRAMAPYFQDVFEGEDLDAVQYAVDLIDAAGGPSDTFLNNDPLATAIHDVYRNGAEAALRHLGRAIELYATFEARRRTERLVKEARRLSPSVFPAHHGGRSHEG
jgi:hypothetical protein